MKKKNIVLYGLLALIGGTAFYFGTLVFSLKKELSTTQTLAKNLDNYLKNNQRLLAIDSVLMEGNYTQAIESYRNTLNESKELNTIIPLRIAMAQRLMEVESRKGVNSEGLTSDSLRVPETSSKEIRKLDSLNFALEKAKVQLENMRNQLKEKSFGAYMSFSSTKGTKLHYVGQVKNNMANGTGIALLETGSRYEGEWNDNEREGTGTFYWPDGEYYVGDYKDDMRTGQGTYFWPNGDKYVGEWKNDKRNGKGVFYNKEGKVVTSGIWVEDKLQDNNIKEKKQNP